MPIRTVFERSRREFSLNVSFGLHILLVVEQLSLQSQSRCQDSDAYGMQRMYLCSIHDGAFGRVPIPAPLYHFTVIQYCSAFTQAMFWA